MKRLQWFVLSCFLFSCQIAFGGETNEFDKHFKLLPKPQKVALLPAGSVSTVALRSVLLRGSSQRPPLTGTLASLPLSIAGGTGTIVLQLTTDSTIPASEEAYVLEAKNNQVTISARGQAGLFYGCQTLAQLLEDATDQQLNIPACKITDYPDVPYRAIHLDLKHHIDAGIYYYQMIDRLAALKVNAIIIEFEDKLRYRKAPIVGSGNALSVDEFALLSRYAKERNIEISPLVQGLGHAEFILKHEQYARLRDTITSDWSFDPMNDSTYALQFSLYEDAMAATPHGKYLHVGGDEVGHLGMSELSKKSGLTPLELQMRWLNKVSEFAVQHHRIPIFWDDMLFKLSDLYETTWDEKIPKQEVTEIWAKNEGKLEKNIALFPKECVYMRWNYDAPDIPGNHKALDWYKAHGLKVMAATAAQQMWPMLPRNFSNFQPIKDFARMTAEKKLDGILCTAWDDSSPHLETLWRGFSDFALFSWNYLETPVEEAHALYRHRFYAPALVSSSFNFQDQLEKALLFWEKALLEKGDRSKYHTKFELITLPDRSKNNTWSQQYEVKLEQAKREVNRYDSIKGQLIKAKQLARRNRYALEVLEQINELQIYSSKFLLLLEKYDSAPLANREPAKKNLSDFVDSFNEVRTNFETVFSKTRMMANPEGYILDQNLHHHLANGTNNSDWMFVYELAMNKKVADWLSQ